MCYVFDGNVCFMRVFEEKQQLWMWKTGVVVPHPHPSAYNNEQQTLHISFRFIAFIHIKFATRVHSRVKWIILPPKSTRAAGRNTRRLAAFASCIPHDGDVKAAGFCRKHRGSTSGLVLVREFLGSTFDQKRFTTKSPSWKRSVRTDRYGNEQPLL